MAVQWEPESLEAALYDWHNLHRLQRQQQDVRYWVDTIAGRQTVAVVGAGTGRVAGRLSEAAGAGIIAIDLNPARLRRAELQPGSAAVAGNAQRLPMRAESLDTVIFPYSTMQLLATDTERRQAVDEARRVLKPGGLLAIDVSDRFEARQATDWTQVLKAPCPELGCTVDEWERVSLLSGAVTITKSFRVRDEEILRTDERWAYASTLKLDALLRNAGFHITSIRKGYGQTDTAHRILWLASR